jgi:probable addiction module antidote protein
MKSLKDPGEAVHYLNASLEDDDGRVFLLALRDVTEAYGGVRLLSHNTGLNRESLYRMLSEAGNPSFDSLVAVLKACGLRLAIQPAVPQRRKRRIA